MNELKELALVFLKLGTLAFGGPAAHIAMMEKEFVEKRQWLSQDDFLTMMGFTNLIPGPNSTEMALHIGYLRAKGKGMLVAGFFFIMPAMLMVLGLSWILVTYGSLPAVSNALNGVGPVMLGLILSVIVKFAKPLLKTPFDWALTIGMFGLALVVNELAVLLMAGVFAFLGQKAKLYVIEPISLLTLFLIFLKIGSILYGSGYVLLAFIKTEFLDVRQVLSLTEILDALTIGQLTPGPVFTTATAIGYLIHGVPGGIVATIGIFLPSFLLVYFLHPLFKKLSQKQSLKTFLNGLKLASLALMIKVAADIGISLSNSWFFILTPLTFVVLWKTKTNPTWLILGGIGVGILSVFL